MCSAHVQIRWKFVPSAEAGSTDEIQKKVCHTFDEFQSSLLKDDILHPSEELHRQIWLLHDSKIFDVINSYHVLCKYCKKHFYSRSVPTDINSFFQNHLNSQYHREFRESNFPHENDMITWEKKFKTGRCNLCRVTGMVALVIDEERNLIDLCSQHYCVWDFSMGEKNQDFLRKMSLLIKYCKLSVFKDKFIKPLDEDFVCMLCCYKIPWSGENIAAHLGSQLHLDLFRSLIWKRHKLTITDLLNGFNLEAVTRWIHSCVLKPLEELMFFDYETFHQKCTLISSTTHILDYSQNTSYYCPLEVEKLMEPWKFSQQESCRLCSQVVTYNAQFGPKYQEHNAGNFSMEPCNGWNPYKYYCSHLKDRLRNASESFEKYKKLREGKNFLSLKVEAKNPDQSYVKSLFFKKLALVKSRKVSPNQDNYCNVCDVRVTSEVASSHLTDFRHTFNLKEWHALEKKAVDARFFDFFQKLENQIICLLCGVFGQSLNFFNHLKSVMHTKRFEWYCSLENVVPISSAIKIRPDMSLVCYLCDSIILKKIDKERFKIDLSEISNHWPCPALEGNNFLEKKEIEECCKPNWPCLACPGNQESHSRTCPTNTLNFKGMENAITQIMNASEDAVFEKVLDKTKSTVHEMDEAMAVNEEACDCGKRTCNCEVVNGDLKLETAEAKEEDKNDVENEKTDDKTFFDENEPQEEILVVSGLEKCETKTEFLSKIKKFKKIYGIYYGENFVELRFIKPGVAKMVAASDLLLKEYPFLTATIEFKKSMETKNKEMNHLDSGKSKFPPIPPELMELLEKPPKLLNFVVELTAAASAAAESETELEREKRVCQTINSAAFEMFPRCTCYPFGSRLSGLMFSDSDLDVFMDCGGMYEGSTNISVRLERKLINNLAALLRKKPEVSNLLIIDRARVPIISFYHKPTDLHCDLSMKNALSVHNTLLIRFIISLDYQIKFMIMFLKHWVKKTGIHGPPFFSSYAITMMAIFYLQQLNPPMAPTIEQLQSAFVGPRLTIGGWNCSFSENRDLFKSEGEFPFHVILRGFFGFYADFDYVKFVISPLDGKPLPREAFLPNSKVQLPLSYKRHILNFPLPLEKLVCKNIPICVIDPFDLSHVLTKGFTPTGLQMFKYYCQLSSETLKRGILSLLCSDDVNEPDT